ncbi:MAG: hypothetical protein CL912_18705 [Deltaproteobacteria bacterium]|nr:hypothetical protein [Deltaproteobacteria bacterium]
MQRGALYYIVIYVGLGIRCARQELRMAASTGLHAACCSRCDQKSVEHNVQLVWLFDLRNSLMNVICGLIDAVASRVVLELTQEQKYETEVLHTENMSNQRKKWNK